MRNPLEVSLILGTILLAAGLTGIYGVPMWFQYPIHHDNYATTTVVIDSIEAHNGTYIIKGSFNFFFSHTYVPVTVKFPSAIKGEFHQFDLMGFYSVGFVLIQDSPVVQGTISYAGSDKATFQFDAYKAYKATTLKEKFWVRPFYFMAAIGGVLLIISLIGASLRTPSKVCR